MALKLFKPTTPGLRGKAIVDTSALSKVAPCKALTHGKKRISSRDTKGRISVRRRGGGHKRRYRIIDFKREKVNIEAVVKTVEYDPNRSAFIALVAYKDGEKRYHLATENMREGQVIISGDEVRSVEGNTLSLSKINIGSFIHNIEMMPGRGGQMVRSAGSAAKLLGRDGKYATVELPSGEVRKILSTCRASVGVVSNKDKKNEKSGKAGRGRWFGRRPKVRGVVMNPVDHPMGGGEGRSSGGRHPCSPTGVPSKGFKTRSVRKWTSKFIVRSRKTKRR